MNNARGCSGSTAQVDARPHVMAGLHGEINALPPGKKGRKGRKVVHAKLS